ncbi:MAG TPA: FAD-dependent oxidoreductase [Candidatus Krumholzibacteria bacterium]|nr:FAD-dependent oxidoreductase [Candidatus Krumholzibacteria bacterium]
MSEAASLRPRVDVLVFGGGIAGLWTLHELLARGYDAHLCETSALGAGQTIQSQGIVHGGGKYALRSVGDLDAVRAIRDMPERWRAHRSGLRRDPDLRAARLNSEGCWLWLPRGSWWSRLQSWGIVPLLRHGGLLACPPESRPRSEWPPVLQRHAHLALRMEEPVFDTQSVMAALREPVVDRLLHIAPIDPADGFGPFEDDRGTRRVRLRAPHGPELEVDTRAVVFSAGDGNAALLRSIGSEPELMQRRPLLMTVLRGSLPPLHAHCVSGGRTRITVTSVGAGDETVWQVGGEVSERHAADEAGPGVRAAALDEIRACLPGLDLSGVQIANYRAVRAEARDGGSRRPSGAHVRAVSSRAVVAWPTKWALAPLLAEDVLRELRDAGVEPSGPNPLHGAGRWPRPDVAPYPWEDAAWTDVNSVEPA